MSTESKTDIVVYMVANMRHVVFSPGGARHDKIAISRVFASSTCVIRSIRTPLERFMAITRQSVCLQDVVFLGIYIGGQKVETR